MAQSSTVAIITRRQDFQESSRLVQMITREHGRHTFLAKGAHRPKSPFLGAIDLLHVVEARVGIREGRGLQSLHSAKVLRGNAPFRRAPLRRDLALHVIDTVRLAMPEGRVDAELFDVLRGALFLFASATSSSLPTIATGIKLRALQALGLMPSLEVCPRTGKPFAESQSVGFAPALGGFVDAEQGGRPVDAELPRLAAELLSLDGRTLGGHVAAAAPLRQLYEAITELLHWHVADRPRVMTPIELFAASRQPRF